MNTTGAGLRFTPQPVGFEFGSYWSGVSIAFDVAGPDIVQDRLNARLHSVANLQSAGIDMTVTPGGSLSLRQGSPCFTFPPPSCAPGPRVLSFPATDFQEVSINGFNVSGIEADFAPTPEPTTLLLFGTTAAGLGVARWLRRRE